MSHFEMRPYIDDVGLESGISGIADRFADVLLRLQLEYDLPSDIWAAAQDLLHLLRGRERS
jgi:hypothetical protein